MDRDQLTKEFKTRMEDYVTKQRSNGVSDDLLKKDVQEKMQAFQEKLATIPVASVEKKPGFIQGTLQAMASPFLKTAASAATIAAVPISETFGGDRDKLIENIQGGVDFGYFGKVTPFGAQFLDETKTKKQQITQASAELAGNIAEVATWGISPIKATPGTGFWGAVAKNPALVKTYNLSLKAPWLTFGTAEGLQSIGEGKNLKEATIDGAVSAGSFLLGGLALKGGSKILNNWGARALQSKAFGNSLSWATDFANKSYHSLPEFFEGTIKDLREITDTSLFRKVRALKNEFNIKHKEASNNLIDTVSQTADRPDLILSDFQRGVAEGMGKKFQKSQEMYGEVKQDQTPITGFKILLDKIKGNKPQPGTKEYKNWIVDSAYGRGGSVVDDFIADMSNKISPGGNEVPQSLGSIMKLWEDSMQYISVASKEEANAIRDFASNLYGQARKELEKSNPTLLNQWDASYQAWKDATDTYSSSFLNDLKSTGRIDTIIDQWITGKVTRADKEIVIDALNTAPEATRELFINSILQKAKLSKTSKDGSEIIQKAISFWEDINLGENKFFTPEQVSLLDDIATFMDGSFDDFLAETKKLVSPQIDDFTGEMKAGVTEDITKELFDQQGRLLAFKNVDEGRLDEAVQNVIKAKSTKDFPKMVEQMTDEERQAVGILLAKDILDSKLDIGMVKDGNLIPDEKTLVAFKSAWENIKDINPETLSKIYSEEQISNFNEIGDLIEKVGNVKELPPSLVRKAANAIIAIIYAAKGLPLAIGRGAEAVLPGPKSAKAYKDTIQEFIDKGIIEPNKRIKLGDFLKTIEKPVSQTTGNIPEGMEK